MIVVAVLALAVSLAALGAVAAPTAVPVPFSDALARAVSHGYFAGGPVWNQRAPELEQRIASARSVPAARPAAGELVALAGGRHSALLSPADLALRGDGSSAPRPVPSIVWTGRVAVLTLPPFVADDAADGRAYATASVQAIRRAREQRPCGWVVDLRQNSGGTMLAMLAAVSPLLPDGPVMSVLDRQGTGRSVRVVGNSVNLDGDAGWASGGFPAVKVPSAHVAVLTGGGTASAAEAVALAFRASATERSFGGATAGLTSYNEAFPLPGGWAVRLTTAAYADLSGRTFPDVPLQPDVETAAPLDAAVQWLSRTAPC